MQSSYTKKRPTGTRKKILDVAARQFAEKGYGNTSVRDIAAELNIANPSLYYHFKSKADILQELMEEPMAVGMAAMQEAMQLTGEARVRHMIAGLLKALEVHSGIAIMALRDNAAFSAEQRAAELAMRPQILDLLGMEVSAENKALRLTMTIGAVQAAVMDIMKRSDSGDAFVTELRASRTTIIDLAMRLLNE